jgi:hypothetical protein
MNPIGWKTALSVVAVVVLLGLWAAILRHK